MTPFFYPIQGRLHSTTRPKASSLATSRSCVIHRQVLLPLFTRLFHFHLGHPSALATSRSLALGLYAALHCAVLPIRNSVTFLKGPYSTLLSPLHCQGTEWQKIPLQQIGPRCPGWLCPALLPTNLCPWCWGWSLSGPRHRTPRRSPLGPCRGT